MEQYENWRFRHEDKYIISAGEKEMLLARVGAVAAPDSHATVHGNYLIRSIYFDNYEDKSFYENAAGVDERSKWRIRSYNLSDANIVLERKSKKSGMIHKDSCRLSREMYDSIMDGSLRVPSAEYDSLLNCFLAETSMELLQPVVIVQYLRYPFVYGPGNVRVTLDCDICSGRDFGKFFDADLPVRNVQGMGQQLLEVKYDEFLPTLIYHTVQLREMQRTSFSKYYLCRKFSL